MIHIVVFIGQPSAIEPAAARLRTHANGYAQVSPSTWVVGYDHEAQILRDLLGSLPGVSVLVARLSGNWAGRGIGNVGDWLQNANPYFFR